MARNDLRPVGLDETQMERFEQLIEIWIKPYDDTD